MQCNTVVTRAQFSHRKSEHIVCPSIHHSQMSPGFVNITQMGISTYPTRMHPGTCLIASLFIVSIGPSFGTAVYDSAEHISYCLMRCDCAKELYFYVCGRAGVCVCVCAKRELEHSNFHAFMCHGRVHHFFAAHLLPLTKPNRTGAYLFYSYYQLICPIFSVSTFASGKYLMPLPARSHFYRKKCIISRRNDSLTHQLLYKIKLWRGLR